MQDENSSPLFLSIIALIGVGLVQVYSTSYIFATEVFDNGLQFFIRQVLFAVISVVVLIGVSRLPLRWVEKFGWVLWMAASVGLLLTFIPGLGVKVGGASRWIQLPFGVRFEPSELLKFSFPLLFGSLLARNSEALKSTFGRFKWWTYAMMVGLPLIILLKQPDFGSFVIILCVGLGLLFAFGLKWRYILASVAILIPSFYVLVMRVPYRRARMMAFLDPWSDPAQKGFQVIQSMLSFHSGGLTGEGLGQGQGKLFFLPEAHTDFTLAVFGEEMGFIGFLVLLGIYGFVIFRAFQIAIKSDNFFHKAFATGTGMTFGLSVFINAGVVMGLLPTKGLTLPFLSYGGSSLVTLCLMFGILLNIERNLAEQPQNPFARKNSF